MPLYFFDIHGNDQSNHDDVGTELPSIEAARREAMRALPDVARGEIAKFGDTQSFIVLVKDENGQSVYSATLNFSGKWL